MAVLTDVCGLDMSDVLAHCRDAVVAREAIAGDAGVIETRRQPSRSSVAGIALCRRGRMTNGLSFRLDTVVTGRATTEYLVVIHPSRWRPGVCQMTRLAIVRTHNVVRRLETSADPACLAMAGGTVGGRANENPANVAAFAVHGQVSPV